MAEDKGESKPSAKKKESILQKHKKLPANQRLLRYIAVGVWGILIFQVWAFFEVTYVDNGYFRLLTLWNSGSVSIDNWPSRSNCGSKRKPCYVDTNAEYFRVWIKGGEVVTYKAP